MAGAVGGADWVGVASAVAEAEVVGAGAGSSPEQPDSTAANTATAPTARTLVYT